MLWLGEESSLDFSRGNSSILNRDNSGGDGGSGSGSGGDVDVDVECGIDREGCTRIKI